MPFHFRMPFEDSLIIKIEVYYEGPNRTNILTLYSKDEASNNMLVHLITAANRRNRLIRGSLCPPEVNGFIGSDDSRHTLLHHNDSQGRKWKWHHHIKLSNITPSTINAFVQRIAAIQENDSLKTCYYKVHYQTYFQQFLQWTGINNTPRDIIKMPILSDESIYRLTVNFNEAYDDFHSAISNSSQCILKNLFESTPPSEQCPRLVVSSDLVQQTRLIEGNLATQSYGNAIMKLALLITLVSVIYMLASRCLKRREQPDYHEPQSFKP